MARVDLLGLDVAIVDNVNVVCKEEVLVLNVTVVSSVLNEDKVVATVEVSVVLHISSSTITASTGQQGIPPTPTPPAPQCTSRDYVDGKIPCLIFSGAR